MREHLEAANRDLLYQVEVAQELIASTTVPGVLTPYVGRVLQICAVLRQQALRNLKILGYGVDDTLIDILAETQALTELFELVSSRLTPPITRAKPSDRLALLLLQWLHDISPETAILPYALTDGFFGVYTSSHIPHIYSIPFTRQITLLYLPLLFHEFGHVLYQCHEPEMKALVKEFQKTVRSCLTPQTVQEGKGATQAKSFRRKVETAWFAWVQEFFCDAVGMTVGGPAYLKAFSHYFRTRSNEEYHVPRKKLLTQGHPVTWLRTKMLVDRARNQQHTQLADTVEQVWVETAQAIGIQEDYQGTWLDEFFIPLRKTLDEMLVECEPYQHGQEDVTPPETPTNRNPVQLCNLAWNHFESDPATYRAWERDAIGRFLKSN